MYKIPTATVAPLSGWMAPYTPPTEAEISGWFRATDAPYSRDEALFEHRLAFDPDFDHNRPDDRTAEFWLDRNDLVVRRAVGEQEFGRCYAAVDLSARVDFTAGALC